MGEYPFAYEKIQGSTWAYLSSLLMLALFFKFNRFWSFRNLDLILIILLVPGLLMCEAGRQQADSTSSVTPSGTRATTAAAKPSLMSAGSEPDGQQWQKAGYVWLFSVSFLILARLIIDPSLTRRPLLDPNLNKGGLFFFGASLC